MQDRQIVELYLNRDETAVSETTEKYGKYLMKIALNILANEEDAKECVNDTYLAVWGSIPPNEPENLSTYLVKLIRRISIDRLRANHRQKRIPTEYLVSIDELNQIITDNSTPESDYEVKLFAAAINSFIKSLPEKKKNVFVARYYFHDSLKSISSSFGISEAKAKSILFRTRRELKEHLLKEGYNV